jgi:hypothetical protein
MRLGNLCSGGARGTTRWVFAAALILLCTAPGIATENPVSGGPCELLIVYRAEPAARPEFRRYLQDTFATQLQKLAREGVLKSYQVLFNPFVQPRTWDAMTLLSFNRFTDTRRWQEIERTSPGGLNAAGLKLAKPVGTYSADLEWEGAAAEAGPATEHVFYVIPYAYAGADQYRKYVNGYVIPQVEGWLAEGALSRYRIYMNRYPVGDPEPWDSLFVYEYRNLEAFGRRDEVTAKVRGPLRADPAWKQWNDIKGSVRTESENTIAELLAGH